MLLVVSEEQQKFYHLGIDFLNIPVILTGDVSMYVRPCVCVCGGGVVVVICGIVIFPPTKR